MLLVRRLLFVVSVLCVSTALGQSTKREPHIGYLYPAGGQQGTVIRIMAGGQLLRGAADVYISGQGVRAKVVQYVKPIRNLRSEQRQLLQQRLREARDKRLRESGIDPGRFAKRKKPKAQMDKSGTPKKENAADKKPAVKPEDVELPDHPLLDNLENKSLRELAHITNFFFFPREKRQINRQLDESVLIEITIEPEAEPGNRELRIKTGMGLTNPMVFQVGTMPEIREMEPNNDKKALPGMFRMVKLPKQKPIEVPVVLNGQIMPGDVDRFCFRALQGQKLVIETHARSLIPYLPDAVPGWFQATLALYDEKGKEVAFADDYRFNPDPVVFYEIPKSGEYELEIRDAIYRGREDFVYRITVGQQPFITQVFPLGGRAGSKAIASVDGWNLTDTQLILNTLPGDDHIRHITYNEGKQFSNSISYAVDMLPECDEIEPDDTIKGAQQIDLPIIINGRINKPGDVDVFKFTGRAGDKVVAEVYGRRLNSPLDSLVRLTDVSGKVLAFNDDHVVKDSHLHKDIIGLATHHADSYLTAELPKDGTYYVHLTDSQNHGGRSYGYRLRIGPPQGDFALRVTPSSLHTRAGGIVAVNVHVLRKDGFDGPIDVVLKKAPGGFELTGGQIPAGCDRMRMTLTTPLNAPTEPVALKLQGRARIDGRIVSRPAVPADDMMQAFLYRHLVPSQQLLIAVKKIRWRLPPFELNRHGPVRIAAGGSAQVLVGIAKANRRLSRNIELQLDQPPEGITLHDVTAVPEGLAFTLKADKDAMQVGFTDNIIVEAFTETKARQKKTKSADKKQRVSMGFLPAIPIEVVQQ